MDSANLYFLDSNWRRENGHPNSTPGVDFLDHDLKKNSGQDLSNKGSNFILSSLKVGHWAAQTQEFFDKFPEITDLGLLQQPLKNIAWFWIC